MLQFYCGNKLFCLSHIPLLIIFSLFFHGRAHGACASLIKGPIAFDVDRCGMLDPVKTFNTSDHRFAFINNFPPLERKQFLDSYRGLIVVGRVARSFAIRSGLSQQKGVLNGDEISIFIPPGNLQCPTIQSKRLKALLDEACCEGGGDAPCLLSSTYVLKDIKVIGAKNSSAGYLLQMQLDRDANYQTSLAKMKQKDFEGAIKILKAYKDSDRLDTRGAYALGLAYREVDLCQSAVPVLKPLYDLLVSNQYWTQNENFVRDGAMLYARCLAKTKNEGAAVITLQTFLLDPKKYRKEIQSSLTHDDFGWIRTSKVYEEYKKSALKALADH